MAHEHNGPAGTSEGHQHDDHEDDVELIEEGTTPVAGVAPAKEGPGQTWRTYTPATSSLLLLLGGIALDSYKVDWFIDPIRLGWYVAAYLPVGWPVLRRAWSSILRGDIFTEFFLMGVATLGAFGIREYPEGVAVMLFYTIGELFQDAAVLRARRSIKALLDVRPDEVTVLKNGKAQVVKAATVAVGDVIQIKPGEKVGLDGSMRSDSGTFDTAAPNG